MSSSPDSAVLAPSSLFQLRELAAAAGISGYASRDRSSLMTALAAAGALPGAEAAAAGDLDEPATHVVFLPRDPQWAYAFWEISPADQRRARAAGAQQLCLRVEDVTGLPLGSAHTHTMQELVVDPQGREWFLPMPLSDRDYRVELGYRLSGGGWLSLAVSSVARVPAEGPSGSVADQFVPFSLESPLLQPSSPLIERGGVLHEQIYQRATAGPAARRRLGSEVLHEQERLGDAQQSMNASGAGLWASGRSESGSGLVRNRSFWLIADAELIVDGATEPDATLFIGDAQVPLEADGSFRVHVPFCDGQQLYPIRAVAADGIQQRSIRLEFDRRTPQAKVNRREEALVEWF